MPNSPDDALATMIRNLKEKTGKSLDEWVAIARGFGFSKHKEILTELKTRHGLTHGYANLVTLKALESPAQAAGGDDGLVDAQYSGPKAALRPIYDQIVESVKAFGGDVEISPKKTYVSLRRNKQFGIVQPSTKTRVDVGINLKGVAPSGRLEASGSFNAMVSHKVAVATSDDVDDDLLGWLKQAYDAS